MDKEQQLIWRKAGFLPSIPIALISNAVGLLFLLLSQMYRHNEVFVIVAWASFITTFLVIIIDLFLIPRRMKRAKEKEQQATTLQ